MDVNKHMCKFERIPIDMSPSFFSSDIIVGEHIITALELLFKGQKKSNHVRRCRTCGKYAIECPYCKIITESFDYPLKMICRHCGKVFQVRW